MKWFYITNIKRARNKLTYVVRTLLNITQSLNFTNLLRNLVKAKVTFSGILPNSSDGEDCVSPITIGNAACEITLRPGKMEKPLNPFVIYGAKSKANWSPMQFPQFFYTTINALCIPFSHFTCISYVQAYMNWRRETKSTYVTLYQWNTYI